MMAFDTSILDSAILAEEAAREQVRTTFLRRTQEALMLLGPKFGIERAYIFGSVTQPGRFHADSDIDIAVEAIPQESLFFALSAFMSALERNVDIVDLRTCPFAQRIRKSGLLWIKMS
jgi:predicted nucleotidyltransferase